MSGRRTRFLPVVAVAAWAAAASAQERQVYRGAQAGAPVAAVSVDIDLALSA